MSDSKRATLITVGAPKSAKKNVTQTVRLTINLDESNESKYPELNYKELVIAEERKKKVAKLENGKQKGLDPFSDNDDDVERVARKFEQKYGGTNTYGRRKGKRKHDEFADIGAGYDENDSFIDNTDGYDEMIPPECDTLYGGFYINSGSLEFKNVPESQLPVSDEEIGNRRNKRRLSSSSSEEESSDSSSESSQDEKDTKPVPNGDVSHKTEHRKKKNKKSDKKAKRIRRTDSSAATSGKQTSDDNGHGNDESVDSRSSHSDSLTSKPAPSSENVVTSDSSRDATDSKLESSLPSSVRQVLDDMKCEIAKAQLLSPHVPFKEIDALAEPFLIRLDTSLSECCAVAHVQKCAWQRVARILNTTRAKLQARVRQLVGSMASGASTVPTSAPSQTSTNSTSVSTTAASVNSKRKQTRDEKDLDITALTPLEKEAKIVELIVKLQALIEDRKPGMISNYNAECNRVQEEKKKSLANPEGKHIERRLPKRRFPWCQRSRALLSMVSRLAGDNAPSVLAVRVLPLFPKGFVRMPTLLRQADIKSSEMKRQRLASTSQPAATIPQIPQTFAEPIQFPSSLTVTTAHKHNDLDEPKEHKKHNNVPKPNTLEYKLGNILNSFSMSKELTVEKDEPEKSVEDKYLPPNSIGSITITPVNNVHKDKSIKANCTNVYDKQKEPLIRVKTPATLLKEANEIERKEKDKYKMKDNKNHSLPKEKRVHSPLLVETNFQPKEKAKSSPNLKKEDLISKKVDSLRNTEDKIPRPGLIPVQHSPTFAKPDKKPSDPKLKKKETALVIVSDLDPLGEELNSEPVAIDDSSSDVEVIEDKSEVNKQKSEVKKSDDNCPKSDTVPSKDKSVIHTNVIHNKKDGSLTERDKHKVKERGDKMDEDDNEADIDTVMRNLREMQDSQEQSFTSNSYGGVITSAKRIKALKQRGISKPNHFKQNGWM